MHPGTCHGRIAGCASSACSSLSRSSPRVRDLPGRRRRMPHLRRRRHSRYLPRPISRSASSRRPTNPLPGDLDAIIGRGYLRILVAPSRTHFETVDGRHRGRAVDAGVALAQRLTEDAKRDITAVFIETREDQLIPSLLANKGDVAANLLLTFARDEQVAFAPPIKTGIRELVVTDVGPAAGQPRGCRRPHHPRAEEQRSSRQPAPSQRTAEEDQSPAGHDRCRRQAEDRRGSPRCG